MFVIIVFSKVFEGNRSYWYLRYIGFFVVIKFFMDDVFEFFIKSFLRLGVLEYDENKGVDVLMYYYVVLVVLELIDNKDFEMKFFVSYMVSMVFFCLWEIFKVVYNFL